MIAPAATGRDLACRKEPGSGGFSEYLGALSPTSLSPATALWFKRLSERKSSPSGDARKVLITPGSRSKSPARGTYLPP
jgi:hypothetical protein